MTVKMATTLFNTPHLTEDESRLGHYLQQGMALKEEGGKVAKNLFEE
jgi:hypothetical protein